MGGYGPVTGRCSQAKTRLKPETQTVERTQPVLPLLHRRAPALVARLPTPVPSMCPLQVTSGVIIHQLRAAAA